MSTKRNLCAWTLCLFTLSISPVALAEDDGHPDDWDPPPRTSIHDSEPQIYSFWDTIELLIKSVFNSND